MKPHHPSRVIAGAALLALVISFVAPFPVLADETPPPADPTAAATLPPDAAAPESEATPTPVDELPVAEGEPAEPLPAEAPPVDVAPEAVAPPAEPELAALIEAAPDGTTIAVVDTSGELLPLVSQEAAEVIAGGDPVWCPASVSAPTPGLNGCTDSRTRFIELIGDLALLPMPGDGIIWIADDYNSTLAGDGALISIDGDSLTNLRDFKLTLRGGWSGVDGDKTITRANPDDVLPDTTFNGSRLEVVHWRNDVTLSDLIIQNSPTAGLNVTSSGNISLTRVFSHHNAFTGVDLDNRAATSAKAVTVSDSQSNANGGYGGVHVLSDGKITLANVIANDNTLPSNSTGAYLDNTSALTPQPVVVTGLSTFNNNADSGLEVHSLGAITAADLTASGNDQWGADLYNHTAPSAQAVTLTGTNIFTENFLGGLNIASAGAIKLNNVIANSNDVNGSGASLNNIAAASDQPVTLTGASTFKYNQFDGLYIASHGPVTLNNITASGNANGQGLEISTSASTAAGVTLTGANFFNDNFDDGLYVWSNGLIKLNNVTALGNGFGSGNGYGTWLYNANPGNTAGVTLTGTNSLTGNRYAGLYLNSRGPVAISNLTASDNSTFGADIDNSAAIAPQKVTLTGKNVFSGNAYSGLLLYSKGAMALSSLTVVGNGLGGAGYTGAYLANSGVDATGGVTLSGVNRVTDNDRTGLEIDSNGAISVSSLTATGNGAGGIAGDGADLYNAWAENPGAGIKLSGVNVFNDNFSSGLIAASKGPIALASLTASRNGSTGVQAGNGSAGTGSPQKITLSGTGAFNDNGLSGLDLGGYGAITLSSLTASGNGDYGVRIYNAGGDSAQPVTLSGSYNLHANSSTGLYIASYGLIKVNSVNATGNGGSAGVLLGNNSPGKNAGITLSGQNTISDNEWTGLGLYSYGPITVSTLTANDNGTAGSGSGAEVSNDGAATAQKVTFSGTSTFHGNATSGLHLSAAGAISLSNLSANGNSSGDGVYLNNNNGFTAPVTISGTGALNDNSSRGLYVSSVGAINLNTTRLEASRNGSYGVYLTNAGAASPQSVGLKGAAVLVGNGNNNLNISSLGAISVSNLTANGSTGGTGATLYNANPDALGGITVSGTNRFEDNWSNGLSISSYGPVTVNNLTAAGNGVPGGGGSGVWIMNNSSPVLISPPAVRLTGVNNLSGNHGYNLYIYSNGAIAINSLTANASLTANGADISNSEPGSVGGITLTGTNVFNQNYYTGLHAESRGAIAVNNLTASGNGSLASGAGDGAYLYNGFVAGQSIQLTGSSVFNANWGGGLVAQSQGAISANNLTASGNVNADGVRLYNDYAGGLGVTITGANNFAGNGSSGLAIFSSGPVSLTRIFADSNGGSGLWVANNAGGVTVTCGTFVDNVNYGVYASTSGVLKLIGVIAAGNNTLAGNIQLAGGGSLSLVRACPLG